MAGHLRVTGHLLVLRQIPQWLPGMRAWGAAIGEFASRDGTITRTGIELLDDEVHVSRTDPMLAEIADVGLYDAADKRRGAFRAEVFTFRDIFATVNLGALPGNRSSCGASLLRPAALSACERSRKTRRRAYRHLHRGVLCREESQSAAPRSPYWLPWGLSRALS
ncbi:hypothetical protein GCM10029976_029420 [Kribbella albertanoniae]